MAGCNPRTRHLRPGTQIGIATRSRASCLWVQVPLRSLTRKTIPWSKGKDAWVTTRKVLVRFQPGSLLQKKWSVGVLAAHLLGKEEDRVQLPDGPLDDAGRWSKGKTPGLHPGNRGSIPRRSTEIWKVVGYGWPSRFAKPCPVTGMWVQIPCLPLGVPDYMPRW